MICPSLANDWSRSWYAQVLWTIDWSLDMPKSCEWLIGILISPNLANDWSCLNWYAQVLRMINRSTDMPMTCDDLLESWYAQVLWTMDRSLDMPKSCEWLIKVRIHLSWTLKKSPCPGWGLNPGPFNLMLITLPRHYKIRLVQQSSTSVLYT